MKENEVGMRQAVGKTGKMLQVKELLQAGKKSGEIISMGFAPGTVYGAQKRFRRGKSDVSKSRIAATLGFTNEANKRGDDNPGAVAWSRFQREINDLNAEIASNEMARIENYELRKKISILENEVQKAKERPVVASCIQPPQPERPVVVKDAKSGLPTFLI